jgi:hypothetical protein
MAPVAYGALVFVAGTMVISLLSGVIVGSAMWGFKRGLAWGILCVVAYLLVASVVFEVRTSAFTSLNGPPMLMTFLGSYLTGRWIRARNQSVLWVTVAALGGGLVLGALYLFLCKLLFGISLWGPVWVALIADTCLGILAVRMRASTNRHDARAV